MKTEQLTIFSRNPHQQETARKLKLDQLKIPTFLIMKYEKNTLMLRIFTSIVVFFIIFLKYKDILELKLVELGAFLPVFFTLLGSIGFTFSEFYINFIKERIIRESDELVDFAKEELNKNKKLYEKNNAIFGLISIWNKDFLKALKFDKFIFPVSIFYSGKSFDDDYKNEIDQIGLNGVTIKYTHSPYSEISSSEKINNDIKKLNCYYRSLNIFFMKNTAFFIKFFKFRILESESVYRSCYEIILHDLANIKNENFGNFHDTLNNVSLSSFETKENEHFIEAHISDFTSGFQSSNIVERETLDNFDKIQKILDTNQQEEVKLKELKKILPVRNFYFDKMKTYFGLKHQYTAKGRIATFGVSCLIIYKRVGKFKFLLGRRSNQVSAFPNFFHVVPAGMNQSRLDTQQKILDLKLIEEEYDPKVCIFREYLEELFDHDEKLTQKYEGKALREILATQIQPFLYPEFDTLNSLLKNDKAHLHYSGFSFDLMNYRPEICSVLIIEDESWAESHFSLNSPVRFKPNYEYALKDDDIEIGTGLKTKKQGEHDRFESEFIDEERLLSSNLYFNEIIKKYSFLQPENLCPSGASTFFMGLMKFKQWLESRKTQL